MRKKEKRLVIAFHTTHDAMAFEDYCISHSAPGRLIPLPGEISAGCGLAWSAPPESEGRMEEMMAGAGVRVQQVVVIEV